MERHKKKLNIKIITLDAFPIGMATSNRIMSYAKGLVKNDCNVMVICVKPTEDINAVFNKEASGIIDGVSFKYPGKKTIKHKSYIARQIDNFIGVVRCTLDIFCEQKENKSDAIIYYATSTSLAFLIFIFCRLKNILLLKEENEIPTVHTIKKTLLGKFIFFKIHYYLPDGLLLMTERLIKYFIQEKKIQTPYVHLPMTVDFERFNNISKNISLTKYIAYCGVLNNKKDGVDILIDAFSILAKDFPDIKLYLIGDSASKEEHQLYKKKILENGIINRVILTGRVSKDAIPQLICNATMLVLARPRSQQADGGFPTKLGEYLTTGKPVIVTSVGEIPNYLTNQVNVFMAEPDSADSLISNMKAILNDYPNALRVANKGKIVVM